MATTKKTIKKTLKKVASALKGEGAEDPFIGSSVNKKAAHSKQHPSKVGYHGTDKETDLNVEE